MNTNGLEDELNQTELRPSRLDQYVGQDELVGNLKVYISAAKKRQEVLDHVLFFGPPGLGKTTLAYIIANEMDGKLVFANGPSIEKPGDIAILLTTLSPGDVLFIDEIHRIPRIVEEVLYKAMEDYQLSLIINKNNEAININIDLPPFTLVGATTRSGDLSLPMLSRFGIVEKLRYYRVEELARIVKRTAGVFNVNITTSAAILIAKTSRGTPRVANRIFKRTRDFFTQIGKTLVDENLVRRSLEALNIDYRGLTSQDSEYLNALYYRFGGGPVGIETLAATLGEAVVNLEDNVEPYLLQLGFIDKTKKGRIIRKEGVTHLKSFK